MSTTKEAKINEINQNLMKKTWNPQSENYQLFFSFEQVGFSSLPIPNDGMVSISSVESQDYFINLGHSTNCHSNLLSDYEYELAKDLILGKK